LITTNVSCAIKPNARSEKAKLRNSLFILAGIVEACWQSGLIRIVKIANAMIIRKTGKLANFKTKIRKYQTYIKKNCLRKQGLHFDKKDFISGEKHVFLHCHFVTACLMYHFTYHKLQRSLGWFKYAVSFHD